MASCKGCGAPVRLRETCPYCGRYAEPADYPELWPDIPEIRSTADFYMAFNKIINKYIGEFDTVATRDAFQDDLNRLIISTPAQFVPEEFRVGRNPGVVDIEIVYGQRRTCE